MSDPYIQFEQPLRTDVLDFISISSPANPSSGVARMYYETSSGLMKAVGPTGSPVLVAGIVASDIDGGTY